jgi:hypothetical protein
MACSRTEEVKILSKREPKKEDNCTGKKNQTDANILAL